MTCHYPAHLGQSSQDFKKSLKKCRVTRGKSPSPSLGALNINLSEGLRTIKHFLAMSQTLATRGNDKSPQNPSHRMTPSKGLISENLSPAESTSRILEDFPQRRCHLSSGLTTGFISPTTPGFPSLSLPLRLLQIKGPQLLFPSRLLYNPQQVTVKPGPDQISVQLRLPSRATDNRDS